VETKSLSALLAAIVLFAIGWSVVLRDRRRRPYNHFATLCFILCFWDLAIFLEKALQPPIFHWFSLCVAVLVPLSALQFFGSFLADDPRRGTRLMRYFLPPAGVAYLCLAYGAAFSPFFRGNDLRRLFEYALGLYVFLGLYACTWLIYRKWMRTTSRVERLRLLYLLIGGVAAVSLSMLDFLPIIGVPWPALGNVLTIIYMYFLSQTLFRYRLLDLNELLGKMVVLATMVVIFATIYVLLVTAISQTAVFFNTLVASFVILILIEPLRAKVEGTVNRWLFQEKYELRRRIDQLRNELANVIGIADLVKRITAAFEETRRVTHVSIYLLDQDGSGYDLVGALGPRPADRIDAVTRRPFFDRLRRDGVLSMEGLEREKQARLTPGLEGEQEAETLDAVIRTMEEMNASVCLPMMGQDAVLGLLCMRDERLREAYSTDEIDLFRGVAAQAAITIQNSQVYERMKERERLAALGEMAAGLAHEIRNPLGSIKGAAQYLLPEGEQLGSAKEFLSIIVDEVNRLNKVVSQFLDYARPYRGDQAPLDVNDVVKKTAQLLQSEAESGQAPARFEIATNLSEELPPVRADAEQLRQVFLNLGLNALQAMPQGGKLTISTGVRRGARRGEPASFLEVRFRDTGQGIAPGDLKNLFIPFYTTKERGTGLGLPISQRIIENHGGTIEVRSQPGKGATFTVLLPIEADAFAEMRRSSPTGFPVIRIAK
jgi:signal transduction histidine kinase